MFEFAGLVAGFGVVDGESVFEKELGEAVAANNVAGAASAGVGELHVTVGGLHELQFGHASKDARGRFIGDQRESAGLAGGVERVNSCGFAFFTEDPDLFEKVIKADFVVS